jgi:hypothetical protein
VGGRVPPEARVGATTLAATVAAVAILEVLQQTVETFDPRPEISVLIVVAVSFATLALSVLQQRVTRTDQLDDALRGWPLQSAERADPYRYGVFPPRGGGATGDGGYIRRGQVDEDIEAALLDSGSPFVLVTGPRRVGKSRTALEAVQRAMPEALIAAPEDGVALRTLLDLDPPLFSRRSRLPRWSRSSRAVLWLDGLNRFFGEIDGDLLDDVRRSAVQVTTVATVRDEDYEAALEGTGDEAEGAKTVAAEALEFELKDAPPDGAGAGVRRDGSSSAGAPAEIRPPTRDPFFVGPVAVSLLSIAAIFLIVATSGFSKPVPPSLAEQADEELREAGGEVVWGPEQADLHGSGQQSQLFVFDPGGTASHEIRIYDERGGKLVEAFRFRPAVVDAEFQFRSLADLGGGGSKLIGGYGFQNQESLALLPFVIRWDIDAGEYTITALQDEPERPSEGVDPAPDAREYLEGYRERLTLRDTESERSISGYRVQDFAIVEDPDRLVSAIALDPRTASEPGRVEVLGNILSVSGPSPSLVGCRFPGAPPLLGTWSPGRLLYAEALDFWEPFIKDRECVPDQ